MRHRCYPMRHRCDPMRSDAQVRGSGGVADKIALAKKDPHTFIPDEGLMEVVTDGNIEAREDTKWRQKDTK